MPWEMETTYASEVKTYRRFHAVAGGIYALWWFAIHYFYPQYFNPIGSRAVVCGLFLGVFVLSYFSRWVQRHIRVLLYAGNWILTLHYFYQFYVNNGDSNWVIGTFVVVMAANYTFMSPSSLALYSLFVTFISVALVITMPPLATTIFLPGLVTVLLQANVGMRSRLAALRELAEGNEQFQMLFNSAFEGILVHENRMIVNANEALAKMVGVKRESLIGRNVMELIYPEDREKTAVQISTTKNVAYETRGLKNDGQPLEIEVRAKSFTFRKKQVRLVTVQEISDRKKMEKERINARTMEENVRVRDEFISIASHELKTPLTSLKLRTQMMDRELARLQADEYSAPKVKDFVAIIIRQLDRLSELVESMLDVSRISLGKFHLLAQPVDLSKTAEEAVTLLLAQSQEKRMQINLRATPGIVVMGDPSRLSQVVENLLTNALKYGAEKPVDVMLNSGGDTAVLEVKDSGIGIGPEHIEKIFERFERAISSKNISGLGLGLYITRQIVQAHGGTIGVVSELGKGSVFTVKLPLSSESPLNS